MPLRSMGSVVTGVRTKQLRGVRTLAREDGTCQAPEAGSSQVDSRN